MTRINREVLHFFFHFYNYCHDLSLQLHNFYDRDHEGYILKEISVFLLFWRPLEHLTDQESVYPNYPFVQMR